MQLQPTLIFDQFDCAQCVHSPFHLFAILSAVSAVSAVSAISSVLAGGKSEFSRVQRAGPRPGQRPSRSVPTDGKSPDSCQMSISRHVLHHPIPFLRRTQQLITKKYSRFGMTFFRGMPSQTTKVFGHFGMENWGRIPKIDRIPHFPEFQKMTPFHV